MSLLKDYKGNSLFWVSSKWKKDIKDTTLTPEIVNEIEFEFWGIQPKARPYCQLYFHKVGKGRVRDYLITSGENYFGTQILSSL